MRVIRALAATVASIAVPRHQLLDCREDNARYLHAGLLVAAEVPDGRETSISFLARSAPRSGQELEESAACEVIVRPGEFNSLKAFPCRTRTTLLPVAGGSRFHVCRAARERQEGDGRAATRQLSEPGPASHDPDVRGPLEQPHLQAGKLKSLRFEAVLLALQRVAAIATGFALRSRYKMRSL